MRESGRAHGRKLGRGGREGGEGELEGVERVTAGQCHPVTSKIRTSLVAAAATLARYILRSSMDMRIYISRRRRTAEKKGYGNSWYGHVIRYLSLSLARGSFFLSPRPGNSYA